MNGTEVVHELGRVAIAHGLRPWDASYLILGLDAGEDDQDADRVFQVAPGAIETVTKTPLCAEVTRLVTLFVVLSVSGPDSAPDKVIPLEDALVLDLAALRFVDSVASSDPVPSDRGQFLRLAFNLTVTYEIQ